MENIQTFCTGIPAFLQELAKGASQWLQQISPAQLGIIIAICILWLFFGFLAGSFAEKAGKKPRLHIWLGLLLPCIYAVITGLILFSKLSKERREQQEQLEAEAAEKAAAQAAEEQGQKEAAAPPKVQAIGKPYIDSIRLNQDGSFAGPFDLTLKDGATLRIVKFAETQALFTVVELDSSAEGEKTIRLPYMRIVSVAKV